jgi:hypothetical protein
MCHMRWIVKAAFYIIVLGEVLCWVIVGSPTGLGLYLSVFQAVEMLVIALSF